MSQENVEIARRGYEHFIENQDFPPRRARGPRSRCWAVGCSDLALCRGGRAGRGRRRLGIALRHEACVEHSDAGDNLRQPYIGALVRKPNTIGEMTSTMPASVSSVKCTGSGTMFATLSSQSVIRL
jgi:hypothetical protein